MPQGHSRDAALARLTADWFAATARPLPWRSHPRDPWGSLVSEFMLQQTQVARVAEKFGPFLVLFPTPTALAAANEQTVLAAWAGLGYYRRARLLHAAARRVVDSHHGRIPADFEALRALPGVGRYTAGSLASIVFGQPRPIVDGNVARVLMRLHGRRGSVVEPRHVAWLWRRAGQLVEAAAAMPGPSRLGPAPLALFNEGLMELGATVCTPRSPRCSECPIRALCVAGATGSHDRIPAPKPPQPRRVLHCASVVVRDRRGRVLVEQRPGHGLWARMWQAPTVERLGSAPTKRDAAAIVGAAALRRDSAFSIQTSHRDVRFVVFSTPPAKSTPVPSNRRWVTRAQLTALALSNPQRRILLDNKAEAPAHRASAR